jgi:serine/threonine protein phosphatase PrpC
MTESFGEKPKTLESKEDLNIVSASESIQSERIREGHTVNEDQVLEYHKEKLFGVFDGIGGHAAGDAASRIAKTTIANYIEYHQAHTTSVEAISQILRDAFRETEKAISAEVLKDSTKEGMGTTASVLKVFTDETTKKSTAIIANVGDSRVYKLSKDGQFKQISVDDDIWYFDYEGSLEHLTEEERNKIREKIANAKTTEGMTAEENLAFKHRNSIRGALGGNGGPAFTNIFTSSVEKGDRFIITTDGIHDNLTTDEIKAIVSAQNKVEDIAKNLTQKSLEYSRQPKKDAPRAKKDDMSAVILEIK